MIQNYLKIAWRNLLRHKIFSLINILGLSTGIAACFMIYLYVQHELSYDQYNKNADRIVRITTRLKGPGTDLNFAGCPIPLGATIKKDIPEVKATARLQRANTIVTYNNEPISENNFFYSEASVFDVLSFSFVEGNATSALEKPNTIVLTETMAKKYFGSGSALGKTLVCDGQPWQVSAVVKDRAANSDMKIDALRFIDASAITAWLESDFDVFTFALFNNNKPDLKAFEKKLNQIAARFVQPELDAANAKGYKLTLDAEMLRDVHFSKEKMYDTPKGNKQFNYIFSILAAFILIIALLNYINLSTARATERAKEVGIRKVNGARPLQLISQFLFESFLLISIAWGIAVLLVMALLPLFNSLLETKLVFNWQASALFVVAAFVATILLAGLYPAFVLSSFAPVQILKGKWRHSSKGIFLRKTLTVAQFAITAALVTGLIVIYAQLRYIKNKDLGFAKDQVLTLYVPLDDASQKNVNSFASELKQQSIVKQVSVGYGMRTKAIAMANTFAQTKDGKAEFMANYSFIDKEFLPMLQIQLKEGRNLSDSLATDKKNAFLVNEAMVAKMGWQNAIGQTLEGYGYKGQVVGVVKNYYYQSLHNIIEPMILVYRGDRTSSVMVKTASTDLNGFKTVWKKHFPGKPFAYQYLDEAYAAEYRKDDMTMTLFTWFTVLAILISCFGLYGLVSLIAVQRTKEIGIRKVLGASLQQLLSLLTKDFVKLITLASLIALPLAGYAMYQWLTDYAYHINLQWWMFLLPVATVLIIALAVIAQQVIKAALANPVNALRSE
jgi:putative ABC transport system permease protein